MRQQIAERYGVAAAAADWVPVLQNSAVTGVVIATPAPLHADFAAGCLVGGRHVLIEKPLSLDRGRIDAPVAARDRVRRFASAACVLHLLPALQAAGEFLHVGSFGPVRHAAVTTGWPFPPFRPAYREIYYRDHRQGGGTIQDALTHMASAVERVVGQGLEGVTVEGSVNVASQHGSVLSSCAAQPASSAEPAGIFTPKPVRCACEPHA